MILEGAEKRRVVSVSVDGVHFVCRHEGFASCPYLDRIAKPPIWTRGYGETEGITGSSRCVTEREARRDLHHRLNQNFNPAKLVPGIDFRQCELDALASLAYNEGPGVLSNTSFSTLARRLRTKRARHSYWYRKRIYRQELPKWDVAGGQHVAGLANRRKDEVRLATTGHYH